MEPDRLIREYLLLGLRFDRIEEGYVDSFTGDPGCAGRWPTSPRPDPAELAGQAQPLLAELPQVPRDSSAPASPSSGPSSSPRTCARWPARPASSPASTVGFVDEVRHYFDVEISRGDPDRYRAAHARIDEVLGGTGPLAERMAAAPQR